MKIIKNKADDPDASSAVPDFSFAQEISTATVVRLLVSKGIVSLKEILEEEKNTRAHMTMHAAEETNPPAHHKHKCIRRLAAKHRWSRRLTSLLFGWQWRKSRTAPSSSENSEHTTE